MYFSEDKSTPCYIYIYIFPLSNISHYTVVSDILDCDTVMVTGALWLIQLMRVESRIEPVEYQAYLLN